MLAVSSNLLNTNTKDENQGEMEIISSSFNIHQDFPEFSSSDANLLLDGINFDDIFLGIDHADILPDLEMDSELLAQFSIGGNESSLAATNEKSEDPLDYNFKEEEEEEDDDKNSVVSERDESVVTRAPAPANKESERGRKSLGQQKSSSSTTTTNNKRKVKVDWTPELHRRFVQAVEQLGVDKAVPSRILELMGIDCLTRHNIASHLQKYRSHKKHLLAREVEAANWTHKRQAVYTSPAAAGNGGGGKKDVSPWPVAAVPTIGFLPMTSPLMHHHWSPPAVALNHFRPLHVWGHPSVDQSLVHMWPKHNSPSPPPAWAPPPRPPPSDPSYWHPHLRVPNGLTPGTPCFPQPMATTRCGAAPVPGIPPVPYDHMYRVDPRIGQPGPVPPLDIQPTKESIDAAIGDVITKPWLPLPLGLKAPALDSVLVELQRQGIPNLDPPNTYA